MTKTGSSRTVERTATVRGQGLINMADMTIAVYRISGQSGQRTSVRPKRTVRPVEQPDLSTRWPACTCQRCLKPDSGDPDRDDDESGVESSTCRDAE
jgi:hypothetical protein